MLQIYTGFVQWVIESHMPPRICLTSKDHCWANAIVESFVKKRAVMFAFYGST